MNDIMMDRRQWLLGAGAGMLVLHSTGAVAAEPAFASQRIAVTVRGQGKDVLLIPGLASGPGVWNGVVGSLPGRRLHLIQVRGFAGLPPGINRSGPLLQPVADEIARYAALAGLKLPAVVGHSMGGMLAMMLGLKGGVGRVMVVDMLPAGAAMLGGTAGGMGYLADQLSLYFTQTSAGRRYLADIVARTPGAQGSDPDVIANALRDLANTDLGPQLPRMTVPLEVVYAVGADQGQAVEITRRFRAAYAGKKGATLLPLGPSGHLVMADQRDRFNAALRKFLEPI